MTIDFFIRGQFAPNFFNLFLPTTLINLLITKFLSRKKHLHKDICCYSDQGECRIQSHNYLIETNKKRSFPEALERKDQILERKTS